MIRFRQFFSIVSAFVWLTASGIVVGMPLRPDTFSRPMTIRFTAANGGTYLDLSQLAIADDATLGYDNMYDARKLMGGVLDCWMTPLPGTNLTVNYVPRPTQQVSIPFNFQSSFIGQQHFFEFTGDSNLRAFNVKVELYDAFTQQSYDPQFTPTVSFLTVQGNVATYQNRFFLRYGQLVGLATQLAPVLTISPVPAESGSLVRLGGIEPDVYSIQLFDSKGQLVSSFMQSLQDQGAVRLPAIPAGQYVMELYAATTKRRIRQRFVVR